MVALSWFTQQALFQSVAKSKAIIRNSPGLPTQRSDNIPVCCRIAAQPEFILVTLHERQKFVEERQTYSVCWCLRWSCYIITHKNALQCCGAFSSLLIGFSIFWRTKSICNILHILRRNNGIMFALINTHHHILATSMKPHLENTNTDTENSILK